MTTKLEFICQSIYQLLLPDLGDSLYVARVAPFALPDLPVTNVWPVGEPAPERHTGVTTRALELAIVSQVTGDDTLSQIESRRLLVHQNLLMSANLNGAAQMIKAGVWQIAPDPELPVLTLTQQFFVTYQLDYLEI